MLKLGYFKMHSLDRKKDMEISRLCVRANWWKMVKVNHGGGPSNSIKHLESQYNDQMEAFNICNGTVVAP